MNRNIRKIYTVSIIILVITFFFSLTVGKYNLGFEEIYKIVTGQSVDTMSENVFFNLRLPRVIMAMLSGIALSMAGSIYQTIFKNPLAAPDLIGVSSGANAGAAIAIVFFQCGIVASIISSFIGGIIAVVFVIGLAYMIKHHSSATYILAGIAIKAIADSILMTMKYFADPEKQLASIDYWTMGSFSSITLDKLIFIIPVFLLGIIGIVLLRWQINLLSLDDEEAKMLGVRVGIIRSLVLISSTLLVASTVCVTGVISFIGLISPHIGRMLLKRSDFNTCILSGIIGAIILLIADCLARSIASSEVPISILTSIIGVPFLVYLLYKQGR
ncbi:MAG: iron ABC transporter permease [Clostridium sp.]